MNFEEDNFICLVWFNQDWENMFGCAERRYDHILSVILLHFLVMRTNNLINYWWDEYHSSKYRCQYIVHRGNLWLIGFSWRFCLLLANWLILLWILHAIFWQLSRLFWLWNLDLSALSGVVVQHCTFWYKTTYHEYWKDICQLDLTQVIEECYSPHTG